MRYDIRFVNSVWVIFDKHTFTHCETFRTFKEAEKKFNAPA